MSSDYKKFQNNVLRYYDFYIEFDGEAKEQVERRLADGSTETFSAWTRRVLGSKAGEIRVYRPVPVDGRTRISTIAEEGRVLKQLIQQFTAKLKTEGKESLQAVEDAALRKTEEIAKKSKMTVIKAKNKAALEVENARMVANQKAMAVPIEELRHIMDQIGEPLEPAVREHLERLVADAEGNEFPLEALLRGMIDTQIQAVQAIRNANNVQ